MSQRSKTIIGVAREWTAALTTSACVIAFSVAAGWLLKLWAG